MVARRAELKGSGARAENEVLPDDLLIYADNLYIHNDLWMDA